MGRPETKVYVCAYHREHDEKELNSLLWGMALGRQLLMGACTMEMLMLVSAGDNQGMERISRVADRSQIKMRLESNGSYVETEEQAIKNI